MRLPILVAAALASFVGLLSQTVSAHHSTQGIYNEDEIVELTGIVKEWRFINPHPSLVIEVDGADGEVQEWDVSYGGPAVTHLKRRGYTIETFKPGDVIVVKGYAAKVKTAYGLLIRGDPVHEDGSPILPAEKSAKE
jgi:hypothetical protein